MLDATGRSTPRGSTLPAIAGSASSELGPAGARRTAAIRYARVRRWLIAALLPALIVINAVAASGLQQLNSPSGGTMIGITPDGRTVVTVNPDSNSVTLIDTQTLDVIVEIAVGVDPRSVAISPDGTSAVVANQGSDSVSVVDLVAQSAVDFPVGDRPVGVGIAPNGRVVAVAELGEDTIRFLDASSLLTLSCVPVADRPHGLAFTPDGRRLLVTHLLSGTVTVLPVRPYTGYLPLIQRLDVLVQRTARYPASRSRHPSSGIPHPAPNIQTWPNIAPAPSVIVDATGSRAYLPQTMASGLQLNTGFDTTVFPKVSVLDLDTESHARSEHIALPEVDRPVGLPWAAALAKGDTELWVVNAGSNDVSVIDISTAMAPRTTAHLPVGDNPRGVVISPDGMRAYVNNVLAGTVSVIETAPCTVTATITVTNIPLPPILLRGKRLFHSSARPDLAKAAWISCNTCHIEGEHDGRTWLLQYTGAVPPGASATITRNTTSLLGMAETYPLRWSAEWDESADSEFSVRFEQFGTGLIDGPMHPTLGPLNQGRSYDLDCLAAFIDGLQVSSRRQPLTPAAARGRTVFESPAAGCASCHPAPLYTDLQVHDVGTANAKGEWFGPLIDTPTLRFLYDSAPYLHDGSAATLYDVLVTANPVDEHGVTSQLTAQEIEDLIAFMLALPLGE